MMALTLRRSPLDFHKRGSITTQLFADPENPVDDHHVFPQGYLDPRGVPGVLRDSILNRTLIDKITNIRIGKRAPSDYLGEVRKAWGGDDALIDLLDSHMLPSGPDSPLLSDDFDAFLNWRERRLAKEIELVTGFHIGAAVGLPPVVPGAAEAEGPIDVTPRETPVDAPIPDDVNRLIEMRASSWTAPLARSLAADAIAIDGVFLRVQSGKGDPWYFQVRHARIPSVVAYVHPRQSELHIEYRLPSSHELYGVAHRRDGSYGIVMKVRQSVDLTVALRLLQDAVAGEP